MLRSTPIGVGLGVRVGLVVFGGFGLWVGGAVGSSVGVSVANAALGGASDGALVWATGGEPSVVDVVDEPRANDEPGATDELGATVVQAAHHSIEAMTNNLEIFMAAPRLGLVEREHTLPLLRSKGP